jgi:hypothetical protein
MIELNAFAAHLGNRAELWREVSAQAFSKARNGFSHQVFHLLNQQLLAQVDQHLPIPRWRGFRLVAADASKLQLFLKDVTGRKVREAIAFMLYLPGPELALSFELYSPAVGERQMLFDHLQHLGADDLALLDRGYPASWVIAALRQRQRHFCMRVDDTGFAAVKAFRRSGQRETLVQIAPPSKQEARDFGVPRKPIPVRLIRVVTPNGKCHVVMTSLLDSSNYPVAEKGGRFEANGLEEFWGVEVGRKGAQNFQEFKIPLSSISIES